MRLVLIAANAGAIVVGLALGAGLRPEPSAARGPAPTEAASAAGPDAVVPSEPRFAFRRPFLVPVADDWRTQSMVVVELELALAPSDEAEAGKALEARLRDRILPALMAMGQEGGFADPLDARRPALEEVVADAAGEVLGGGRPGVVVTSLGKKRV